MGVMECALVSNILNTPLSKLIWCDIVCRVGTLVSTKGYTLYSDLKLDKLDI